MELASVCRSSESAWRSRSVIQHCPHTLHCALVSPAFLLTSWSLYKSSLHVGLLRKSPLCLPGMVVPLVSVCGRVQS